MCLLHHRSGQDPLGQSEGKDTHILSQDPSKSILRLTPSRCSQMIRCSLSFPMRFILRSHKYIRRHIRTRTHRLSSQTNTAKKCKRVSVFRHLLCCMSHIFSRCTGMPCTIVIPCFDFEPPVTWAKSSKSLMYSSNCRMRLSLLAKGVEMTLHGETQRMPGHSNARLLTISCACVCVCVSLSVILSVRVSVGVSVRVGVCVIVSVSVECVRAERSGTDFLTSFAA